MKLNLDCIRDILLTVENAKYEEQLSFDKLHERLPKYSEEDLHYCLIKLDEAGLLEVVTIPVMRQHLPGIKSVHNLTFYGHEFLENIKSDNAWNKTKSIAAKVGSYSFNAIRDISIGVISEIIKQHL